MNAPAVRLLVECFYDVQQMRLIAENRVRAAVRHGLSEEEEKRLTAWVDERMERQEAELKAMVMAEIRREPLWENWLKGVSGVGPCIAGGLMAWLGDCSRFATVSAVWKFCGQHVVDGAAPRRTRGQKMDWNPTLRVLAWKAGKSFVMVGKGYRTLYDEEKARLRTLHPEPVEYEPARKKKDGTPLLRFSDGHVDAMARRKTAKVFLAHYWEQARREAGLPVGPVYILGREGHEHAIPVVME